MKKPILIHVMSLDKEFRTKKENERNPLRILNRREKERILLKQLIGFFTYY